MKNRQPKWTTNSMGGISDDATAVDRRGLVLQTFGNTLQCAMTSHDPPFRMRQRLVPIFLVGIFLGLSTPGGSSAQNREVWIEPRIGWQIPTRDLGRTDVLSDTGFGDFEKPDQSGFLGVGAGLELTSNWGLRGLFERSFEAGVTGEWRCAPFVACPAVLLPLRGKLHSSTGLVDVMYSPAAEFRVKPVVFIGVGLRRSRLDWNQPPADVVLDDFSFRETNAVYRVGAGVERSIGWIRPFGEFVMTTGSFGGGAYQSSAGTLAADRRFALDAGFVGGVRFRLH